MDGTAAFRDDKKKPISISTMFDRNRKHALFVLLCGSQRSVNASLYHNETNKSLFRLRSNIMLMKTSYNFFSNLAQYSYRKKPLEKLLPNKLFQSHLLLFRCTLIERYEPPVSSFV